MSGCFDTFNNNDILIWSWIRFRALSSVSMQNTHGFCLIFGANIWSLWHSNSWDFFPFWLKFFEKIKLGTSSKVYLFVSCFCLSNVGSSFCGFERASLSVLAQGFFGLVLQSLWILWPCIWHICICCYWFNS